MRAPELRRFPVLGIVIDSWAHGRVVLVRGLKPRLAWCGTPVAFMIFKTLFLRVGREDR